MSLGLYRPGPEVPTLKELSNKLITTCETLPGYEITDTLGVLAAVAEKSFRSVVIGGVGVVSGGGFTDLIAEARGALATLASERGANAVVGLRIEIAGRELEKSVVAYGTAVVVKKVEGTLQKPGAPLIAAPLR